jgi:hypothetical protein
VNVVAAGWVGERVVVAMMDLSAENSDDDWKMFRLMFQPQYSGY